MHIPTTNRFECSHRIQTLDHPCTDYLPVAEIELHPVIEKPVSSVASSETRHDTSHCIFWGDHCTRASTSCETFNSRRRSIRASFAGSDLVHLYPSPFFGTTHPSLSRP